MSSHCVPANVTCLVALSAALLCLDVEIPSFVLTANGCCSTRMLPQVASYKRDTIVIIRIIIFVSMCVLFTRWLRIGKRARTWVARCTHWLTLGAHLWLYFA